MRFILLSAILWISASNAAVLVIEGQYLNKNIYVSNGFDDSGVGFCAREVRVNGHATTDETNSSTFEIDLKSLHLGYGDKVVIEIVHNDGCVPRVVNMEDLKPVPTFDVSSMKLTPAGLLTWTCVNESGSLPYVIEQFKWNKWVPVGQVDGVGTAGPHSYAFKVVMHSGENRYRIRQRGFNSTTKVSKDVQCDSGLKKPAYAVTSSSIDFSDDTSFEVYDAYGNIVKKGFGRKITIDNLSKGDFYLCYDNALASFKR